MEDGLAVGVVAVPERLEQATDVALKAQAQVLAIDYEHRGERWCHQEALMRLTGFDATWLILIEDDAVLTDDFRERAAQALAAAPPDSIVSFYLGTGPWAGMGNAMREHLLPAIIEEGRTTGWVKSDRLFNAVAFAVPMMLAPLIRYYMSASDYPTDTAIGQWTLMMHVPVWYTFPPLVDHADGYSYVDGCEPIITRKALS